MYFSERRKQGLGSLRPGYFIGGPIGNLLMGNAVNWGLNKGINYLTKSKEQREDEKLAKDLKKLGVYGYFPEEYSRDDNNDGTTKSSGWKGGFKGGLMNLLATAFLGPLMGPIALTVGRGLMNKSKGLGFTGGDGGSGPGPKVGPQIDYYTGSDEEDKDIENQITKNFSGIDSGGWDPGVASTTVSTTSVPSHIGPSPHSDNGGSSNAGAGEAANRGDEGSGWESSPFFKGGRVSYSKGGIASLWQR